MRQLSATLAAAQKRHITQPAATVTIDERHCGIMRPRWELFVSDTVGDGPSVIGVAYDGACIRARSDPDTQTLHVQRVVDRANTGEWTAWTLLESGIAGDSQLALAYDGEIVQALFFVAGDRRTIKARQSADNGQTWGAAATVATVAEGSTVRALAASLNSGSGTLTCFYGAEIAAEQVCLYSTSRVESGGSWSSPQDWGRGDVSGVAGLDVSGDGATFHVAACLDNSLWLFNVGVGDLGAWPDPVTVLRSDTCAVAYAWPSIAALDQHRYLFFVENNTQAGYARLHHVVTPNWQDMSMAPRPYQMAAGYGAHALSSLTHHYLCTSRYVYRAKRWAPDSTQRVDISGDVLGLRLTEYLDRPGQATLLLRNDDGRYAAVGDAGDYQAIKRGSQVAMRLGYRTSAGNETSTYRPYWITGISHQCRTLPQAAALLRITAADGWGILDRAHARQTYTWQEQSALAIARAILAGYGFYVTDDGNDAWSRIISRFSITPGMALGDALRRVLRLVGGWVIFRCDEQWELSWPSATAYLTVGQPDSTYAYGIEHAIIAAEVTQAEQAATHVMVLGEASLGDAVLAEAIDWDMVEEGNEDRFTLLVERRLATVDEAAARAAAGLEAAQRAALAGLLTVPPNVGQEVLDVITVTVPTTGLEAATLLVAGNQVTLDREKGVFEQRLQISSGS